MAAVLQASVASSRSNRTNGVGYSRRLGFHSPAIPQRTKARVMSKALVVDDSKTIRMIIRRILTELGTRSAAGNGIEPLRMAARTMPWMCSGDWNMPEMNGLELLKQLRAIPIWHR